LEPPLRLDPPRDPEVEPLRLLPPPLLPVLRRLELEPPRLLPPLLLPPLLLRSGIFGSSAGCAGTSSGRNCPARTVLANLVPVG